MDADAPCHPWPDEYRPLSREEAIFAILFGEHREAREQGRDHRADRIIIAALRRHYIALAYAPDDTLIPRPTALAMEKFGTLGVTS